MFLQNHMGSYLLFYAIGFIKYTMRIYLWTHLWGFFLLNINPTWVMKKKLIIIFCILLFLLCFHHSKEFCKHIKYISSYLCYMIFGGASRWYIWTSTDNQRGGARRQMCSLQKGTCLEGMPQNKHLFRKQIWYLLKYTCLGGMSQNMHLFLIPSHHV
jgi:hypothetical protein